MADSPFNTFDLGKVIQTAEVIKNLRRQGTMDKLQEQYLTQRIDAGKEEADRAKRAEQIVLGKEKASAIDAKVGQIFQQPDMKGYVERAEPDLVKSLQDAGVDWQVESDETLRPRLEAMQNRARQELGQAPVTAEQVGDFKTLQQGGKVLASQAPQKPAGNPNAYDEFVLSQKDPAFADFLKQRKGKGLSVTLPDGTVVEMGGEGGGVGPGELSKPTVNNLQETIVNSTNRLDRLNQTMGSYKPEYLQARGMIDANTTKIKDFLGVDVKPEDKKFLEGYTEFRANAANDFNMILKELSGTAVSAHEMPRLRESMPSKNDTPTEFESKAKTATKNVTRAIMRANWALKNGIGIQSIDELSKRMPLGAIDSVYEARANEIWQGMGGTAESKQKAIDQANQEFGLAR